MFFGFNLKSGSLIRKYKFAKILTERKEAEIKKDEEKKKEADIKKEPGAKLKTEPGVVLPNKESSIEKGGFYS